LTYAQAAELTWPQLMHALGIYAEVDREDLAGEIAAKQDEIFDRIVARRGCLPIDLWRWPVEDLRREVGAETRGSCPTAEILLGGLRRYLAL
jgi:hypothetical protein